MRFLGVANLPRLANRLKVSQSGATAAEYAAILAAVVIAVIVSAMVVGKGLNGGVDHMKSSLAVTTPLGAGDSKTSDGANRSRAGGTARFTGTPGPADSAGDRSENGGTRSTDGG